MPVLFWSNTVWYILLGISTIIEMIFVLTKARNKKLILAMFFTVSGITFTFELTIFCFLKGYNYYPMLVPNNSFDDGLAGNLFSQFSITASALLFTVYKLNFYWYFIFAAIYSAIEELFLRLGIYEHFWYQTWMTFAALILLFWIVKKIYENSLKCIGQIFRYIYILFGLYTLHMPTIIYTFKLLGIQTFSENIISDKISSYSLLAVINLFLLSNVLMIIHLSKLKWVWRSVVLLILYAAYYIANKYNLILIKDGWFFVFTTINIFGMYLYVFILDKLYDQSRCRRYA